MVTKSVLRIVEHSLCLCIYVPHHKMEGTAVVIPNVVKSVDVPIIHVQIGVG